MIKVVSTRFNDITWQENFDFRIKNTIECIYGTPLEMPPHICLDSNVFVIEMNNSKNKIEGIGLIRNKTHIDKYYKIYHEGNYNRYIYKGNYYLNRDKLLFLDEELVKIFDYILFKEKTHLKRGSGFTSIPEKLLNHSICENINIKRRLRELFINNFTIIL
uniref:Uncharacterized protein n=1 Tax=viral metagenome TaxID=1070528 RepID=A0A6C0DV90_9ZZZZ